MIMSMTATLPQSYQLGHQFPVIFLSHATAKNAKKPVSGNVNYYWRVLVVITVNVRQAIIVRTHFIYVNLYFIFYIFYVMHNYLFLCI